MRGRWELSDAQWKLIEPILRPRQRADGRGRPWQDTRAVLNGILWVLGTGAQWRELPKKYPPYQTCHRRFQQWVREGKLERILRVLAEELHARGKIATGGGFHRRLLHGGKKGGLAVGPTKRGKGTKIIAITDDHGLPLAVSIESASPHESQLVEGVLGQSFLDTLPARLIGDKALRQRPPGPGSGGALRHRDDRTASRAAPPTDPRWTPLAALPQTLARGATLCLAASLSSAGDPLGVPRRELLRHGPPRLHANLAQVFMRPVLAASAVS